MDEGNVIPVQWKPGGINYIYISEIGSIKITLLCSNGRLKFRMPRPIGVSNNI